MRRKLVWSAYTAIVISWMAISAAAQRPGDLTPCGIAIAGDSWFGTHGLTLVAGGLVYDANQGLCWLADANLAGDPLARATITPFLAQTNPDPDKDGPTTPEIYPDGTMNYETALNWVDALNRFNGGRGWLNHNNWQLPTTQLTDVDYAPQFPGKNNSCSSQKQGNFGALCKGSALGNLYNVGLARVFPDIVVPMFFDVVWPFVRLQPGLYWTSSPQGAAGYSTFSFNSGDPGANTTNYNFLHVLPTTQDMLGAVAVGPRGAIVRPFVSGPGAGRAVFDTSTGLSWPMDANLAATNSFDFTATVTLTTKNDPDVNHTSFPMTVPMINKDGAMHFSALCDLSTAPDDTPCPTPASGWIASMNRAGFGGSSGWRLPNADEIQALYVHLLDQGLIRHGDVRLEWPGLVGPFWRLQPGFYWSCERDDLTSSRAPCNPLLMPGQNCDTAPDCPPQEYSLNFDDGFEGTDHLSKHFYVMVYFPAPATP